MLLKGSVDFFVLVDKFDLPDVEKFVPIIFNGTDIDSLVTLLDVYLIPGGFHMTLKTSDSVQPHPGKRRDSRNADPVVHLERAKGDELAPSVDTVMESAAGVCGRNVVGVILTGLGHDGREGMKAIKAAGGQTIAQDEASSLIFLIRGSYFERFSTCSRPNCACHEGQRHGPRSYVAVTQGKRQRQHYVPKGQQDAVKLGVDQYHDLLEIMCQVTLINLELMRLNALEQD